MIPVNVPLLDGDERRLLCECIDSAWVSADGPFVAEFERRFSGCVGRSHGIAASNGSSALELALAAVGVGRGDEIIMPSFTIISCAAAVLRAGATPVFVDSDPITWNMDVSQVAPRITPRTRAIMAVHTYGLPVDMDPLLDIARQHGLRVIEDAAEAHGLHYRGRPCGSMGDVSTFSFYANKLITTGEGGMALTDDPEIADRCRRLRNLAFGDAHRFVHEELGWNFRMSNLQAAVGLAQLAQLERFSRIKRGIGHRYTDRLRGQLHLQLPPVRTSDAENAYWVYGVVLRDSVPIDAAEAMRRLAARGIGTRPFFWPMHLQPVLRRLGAAGDRALPVCERLARRGFYLPSGLGLTIDQLDASCDALIGVLSEVS